MIHLSLLKIGQHWRIEFPQMSIYPFMPIKPPPILEARKPFTRVENIISFAQIIQNHVLEDTGFPDRHVKQANYKVIKDTTMPAALVETGFLSNSEEEMALFSESTQNKIASAIVDAIKEFLTVQ